MSDEFDEIQKLLSQAQAGEEKLDSQIKAIGEYRRGRDRSFIVRKVIYLYLGGVGACFIYLLYRAAWHGDDVFDNISEVIKVAILPILTLVIGYYFGTTKSE
jgi:tRNA(Glu) U13 pseudouridine synthase TruD